MSADPAAEVARLEQIRVRLEEITAGFGSDLITDAEAAGLAAEAAELTAEAAREAVAAAERVAQD